MMVLLRISDKWWLFCRPQTNHQNSVTSRTSWIFLLLFLVQPIICTQSITPGRDEPKPASSVNSLSWVSRQSSFRAQHFSPPYFTSHPSWTESYWLNWWKHSPIQQHNNKRSGGNTDGRREGEGRADVLKWRWWKWWCGKWNAVFTLLFNTLWILLTRPREERPPSTTGLTLQAVINRRKNEISITVFLLFSEVVLLSNDFFFFVWEGSDY